MNGIHLMPEIFAFIQARSTSSRLPQKVIQIFSENPNLTILDHIFNRVSQVLPKDRIVLLIPYSDTPLIEFCKKKSYLYFEGNEQNVRERYISAALHYKADKIIRITGDNPFLDILHVEMLTECLFSTNLDLISFYGLPIGMGAEAFTLSSLQWSPPNGFLDHHNEHVSLHIKEYPENFKIKKFKPFLESSQIELATKIRVTIDEIEDFHVCQEIHSELKTNPYFGTKEIIELYKKKSEIFSKNSSVQQVSFKLPSITQSNNNPKITIIYADPDIDGSGHFERCKILYVLLQSYDLDVEITKILPQKDNSDLYIIDNRDCVIHEYLKRKKILLLDNFGEDSKNFPTFYSIPNPKLDFDKIKENILISSSIHFFDTTDISLNSILIYAGNLGSKESEILDAFFLKSYGNYEIIRIGGAKPNSNIKYHTRLSRLSFYSELKRSSIFVSYFGQGVLEAAFLKKNIILYSISDYHNTLSKHFSLLYPSKNIGYIDSLEIPQVNPISNQIELEKNGYQNLIHLIQTILKS
jgi:spore coat polysaccharide biosynthesis protein SpsF